MELTVWSSREKLTSCARGHVTTTGTSAEEEKNTVPGDGPCARAWSGQECVACGRDGGPCWNEQQTFTRAPLDGCRVVIRLFVRGAEGPVLGKDVESEPMPRRPAAVEKEDRAVVGVPQRLDQAERHVGLLE